jgi:hypothetical protein
LKSTEEETADANTSTTSTAKHWGRNFKLRVSHQPSTSALKKIGYRNGQNPQHKKTLNKANHYQPNEYVSDSEAGEIDYLRDYHTPTGLVDHKYIWQAKQFEAAKLSKKRFTIRESVPAILDATTPQLTNHLVTMHNVQPSHLGSYIANNFNRGLYNLKHRNELDILATWHISTVHYDSFYTPSPL